MSIDALIEQMRSSFDGFSPPATEADLLSLQAVVGPLPRDVLRLYRDHNGSATRLDRDDHSLPARLLPADEAVEFNNTVADYEDLRRLGTVAWLWTDDNSNYAGAFTSGPLAGWLTKLNHEEQSLTPAYRSTTSFLTRLLETAAYDIGSIPRELPLLQDAPEFAPADRQLAAFFRDRYAHETDEDLRHTYAACAICLTPPADTPAVLPFLDDPDMYTPETAIRLLELRGYRGPVEPIERLARDGTPNGDGAAMRLLARMRTDESRAAIARLRQDLTGQKLQTLDLWTARDRLLPPQWD